MPKRKRLPSISEYEGLGSNPDNAYIQKSRPLQTLAETGLTLPEFKILDAYLARIDSHNVDKRTVKLEKGELERYLGLSRILKDDLNQRLRHLFQTVEIKDESKKKGFTLINLFEKAEAEQDENGLWQITLTCTQSAKEYIFNIDNIGYLRYRLKNVINLTSRYSYILFLYLVDNRFRKTWKIDLSDLKKLMNCTAERYTEFKFFNSEIIKKCQNEINEKTDLKFDYKPVRKGRKVSSIEFTVETLNEQIEEQFYSDNISAPINLIECDEKENKKSDADISSTELSSSDCDDKLLYYSEALDNQFTKEELKELVALVNKLYPDYNDKQKYGCLNYSWYKLLRYDEKKKIKNKISYLMTMITNDFNETHQKSIKQDEKKKRAEEVAKKYEIFTKI